ncbi:MAG: SDR family oxidoreductase [Atribacterota bacterium]|jgi:dihydroflavonol-4-reductase|nr:SDR family oxidoreductase [Atribacterota bacterium]
MFAVTGATGHLGNVLIRELLKRNKKVRAVILPGEDTASVEGLEVERIEGNVLDPDSLRRVFQGIEVVFHCAGIISIIPGQREQLFQVNVLGTKNVVDICLEEKVKRLIHISSIHALSEPEKGVVITEERAFDPENVLGDYSHSKALGSLEVLKGVERGLDAVIICPSGIIGPYDYRLSEMGNLIVSYINGKLKAYIEGAYDFVDVRDVVEGIILASEKGKKGECYILSGQQITVIDILKYLEEISGIKAPSVKIPYQIAKVFGFFNAWYCSIFKTKPLFTPYSVDVLVSNSLFSNQKAKDSLGYIPRPIYESISDSLQWFREKGMVRN